jgi:hypothetical protein
MALLHQIQSLGVKVVFICPDNSPKYTARKHTMQWMLQAIGFPESQIIHFKSDPIPYPACLVKATRDILEKYMDEPVLVLEDDLAYTNQCMFEIPADTDAFYLGLSECAAHPTRPCNYGVSQFQFVTPHTVRIMNMLSAHAVLYMTKRYKLAVIEVMNHALRSGIVNDVQLARLQPSYNVYGGVKPMFYQSRVFNIIPPVRPHVEDQTNIEIHITESKQCIPVRHYGGPTECIKYLHEMPADALK